MKISTNRKTVNGFFEKWQRLQIKNIITGDKFDLWDRSPAHALYAEYFGRAPAGEYTLERFYAGTGGGMVTIDTDASLGEKYGRFPVSEGQLTDLGTMTFLRPNFPANTRLYKLAFANIKIDSDQSIAALAPAVQNAAKIHTLTWFPVTATETRAPIGIAHQNSSMFLNDPYMKQDGSLLVGEAFGQIAQRDGDGKWTWMDTGTLNTIQAIYAADDGLIIAGADQSLLMVKQPKSSDWKVVPVPLKEASIRFIGKNSKLGYIVMAQDRRNILVLACNNILKPEWVELKRIPVELFKNPKMDTAGKAFLAKDDLVVVTSSIAFTTKIEFHVLDAATNNWAKKTIDLRALSYSPMEDGSIFSMSQANIFQNLYVSKDFGSNWEKRGSADWMRQPVFRTPEEGYAIRVDNIPMNNIANMTNSIWKTVDGGKTWGKIGSIPSQSTTLLLLAKKGQMLVGTGDGKIFLSKDDGANWILERSVQ